MQQKILKITILFLCTVGITCSLSAQTKPEKKPEVKQVRIEMTDGTYVDGKLIARQGDTVVLESATLGVLNLNIKNIKNIDALTAQTVKNGKVWFENMHAVHGFVAPTGFNLRKGEGFYGNTFLFFNYAGYGFTDNFSISGGTELFSMLFDGESGGPSFFFLNPKFSFKADKYLTIGAGGLFLFSRGNFSDNRNMIFIPHGVATFGNRDNNLSLGTAIAIVNGETAPLFTASGQGRLARGVSIMSENFISKDGSFGIGGFRFMGKSLAFNLGLMYNFGNNSDGFGFFGSDNVPFVPFLGLHVPFGGKKK